MRFTFLLLFFFSLNFLKAQDELNSCLANQDFHIVVLGSSTAAGFGPTSSDSTWVNRYQKHLKSINYNNTITNLAIGGITTYHIMPDWFIQPPGRPSSIPNNNMSKAISLNADAIIINLPSNDAANNFGTDEQMSNFLTLVSAANSVGIPVWVLYDWEPNIVSRATDKLEVRSGSGITYTFEENNFPRDWNGEVFYHYGFNPLGDCSSGRVPVEAVVSEPSIDLGKDTLLPSMKVFY